MQRNFFGGETEGGPPSTQPQPLGLGLPRARNFLIFNLFKSVFRSLFNAFCSNSSHICLNYRYKFLIYTFSISCLEILGGDSLPPKSLWGETVSLFSPPLHASDFHFLSNCKSRHTYLSRFTQVCIDLRTHLRKIYSGVYRFAYTLEKIWTGMGV